ncbi:MAG: ATP-binding protein [Bacteroidetes bacterium]|nr:ATP-binding protein [Bacteroidota bacterium]
MSKYILKVQHRVDMRKRFLNRTAYLVSADVFEFNDNHFKTDQYVRFTRRATERIFADESILFDRKTFYPGPCILVEHESIKEKALFYDETEVKELAMFEEVIQPAKYKSVVERLEQRNLPTGVTAILHGYPGTGKTESVYQLARKSKRNILLVDISQIRDKYVGESEKQLKEVFNVYRRALKHFDEAPILLFNESDALISKRVNVAHSTDQMNNAMQNVLLQEMENFSGILMATTNLIHNLDSAFDRRFLFKIKFSKPSIESRSKIWKSKIDSISKDEALKLATDFEFSGGQIDNITKKMLMNSLLSNKPCGINEIIDYCENELFVKKGKNKSIGFFLQTN